MKKAIGLTAGLIILCIAVFGVKGMVKSDADRAEEYNSQIGSLDGFYGTEMTEGMDIRDLPAGYTAEDAVKDGAVMADGSLSGNEKYTAFMEDCEKGRPAYIRIVQQTVEGDPIICDIMYSDKADRYYAVRDASRDRFSSDGDISLKDFGSLAEYKYGSHGYLVLYNGKTDKDDLQSDDVLVITEF